MGKRHALELGLLVRVRLVLAENPVEELGGRPGDGREYVHEAEHEGRAGGADGEAVADAECLRDHSEGGQRVRDELLWEDSLAKLVKEGTSQ